MADKDKKKLKAVIRVNMDTSLSSSDNLPDTFQYEETCLKKLRCHVAATKLFQSTSYSRRSLRGNSSP